MSMNSTAIRVRMAKLGIKSQAELARQSNVTPGYMCQILQGKKNVSVDVLKDMCRALGCKAEDIW